MEGDQPVQNHCHAQQPLQPQTCVQEHYHGETGLPSSSLRNFSSTTFQTPELQCSFIWKETSAADSIKKGLIIIMYSKIVLLWNNFFLVSL